MAKFRREPKAVGVRRVQDEAVVVPAGISKLLMRHDERVTDRLSCTEVERGSGHVGRLAGGQ